MKVVVLTSGGLDSTVALYAAKENHDVVAAVSFRYGAKHNDREIPMARRLATSLNLPHYEIPLDFIGAHFASALLESGGEIPKGHYEERTMQETVVPFRNGIMLATAAGFAESRGAEGVVIAAHAGDHAIYPDCREGFLGAMEEAMRLGTYAGVRLLRPFVKLTKAEIVTEGARLGVDFVMTWSCYVGGEIHCGECGTCVERREAFLLAGVDDPTRYLNLGPLPPKPSC